MKARSQERKPVSRVVLLLYNAVYVIGFAFLSLWKMFWDRSYRRDIPGRMGYVPRTSSSPVIWVHGVSVGEVKAAQPLVRALREELPGLSFVISSTTPTGRRLAERLYSDSLVIYYPLDFGPFPGRALDRIRPDCVLLVELELWPNFLHAAERRRVPVAVVNGRISRRSWKGYRLVKRLLPQLDRIDLFCVQNSTYGDRLKDLGVSPGKIKTTGNLKYDSLHVHEQTVPRDTELSALIGLEPEDLVLVGGSTHGDEEAHLANVALGLEEELGRPMRLVVAPRHPERTSSVIEDLRRVLRQRRSEHAVMRLTEQRAGPSAAPGAPWLVVDTIGELDRVYSLADAVFVGGSLVRHGGQNMLEPVALGKPTLFGPHVWNFQADVDLLVAGDGVIRVEGVEELQRTLRALLSNPEEAARLVRCAQEVIRNNQGATKGTVSGVLTLLRERASSLLPRAGSEERPGAGRKERGVTA